jgi:hypothetical protein
LHFDANLCGASIKVEDRSDIADAALEHPTGIGV